ncbi:MAG: D-alanyl-D-alanine carboxypeptidase [Lachnospiraceae bacterium]|nr:D-alanyl-D-alanine carboxypeptidase [Lachnospiraceae bacterium]
MRKNRSIIRKAAATAALILIFLIPAKDVHAVDTLPSEEFAAQWEGRKSLPVNSNSIASWPKGPENGTESAVLMEVDTGTVLYDKNKDEKLYPASTTKMMTALLVVEHCQMDEIVTFSDEAIDNTERGSSRIGIMKGEQLTVEQCLYGLLLGSANEVAYGLAEHVGGDLETFVGMMNDRAAKMGCVNTHFVNASGLPDSEHYVSAYDLATIAREFFSNEMLCMISGTAKYVIPPTNKTDEERPLENHHKMIQGKKYAYEGIVGGKTGFTSDARQTLVTCAQREGMKLICVVMKDESPYQFTDTKDLLDYGFASFQKLNVADNEKRYNIQSASFFHTKLDIMGSSRDILSLNKNGSIVIPKGMDFEEPEVKVDYDPGTEGAVARLDYFIGSNRVGGTTLDYATENRKLFEFANIITDGSDEQPQEYKPDHKTVFVTVSDVVKKLFIIVGALFLVILSANLVMRFIKSAQRAKMSKRKRYKKRSENKRYNYKKRSENKRRRMPGEQLSPRDMYMQPIYKELQKRSASASGQEELQYYDEEDEYNEYNEPFDEDYELYDEDDEPYDDRGGYDEEQMVRDFPEMEGYGIELLPIDHPDRWKM